jgi:hypothetical protein
MLATLEVPVGALRQPGELTELRCKHRTCRALLARVIGATLVCLDGTRVGPVAPGMVVARACPRCKASNRFWL